MEQQTKDIKTVKIASAKEAFGENDDITIEYQILGDWLYIEDAKSTDNNNSVQYAPWAWEIRFPRTPDAHQQMVQFLADGVFQYSIGFNREHVIRVTPDGQWVATEQDSDSKEVYKSSDSKPSALAAWMKIRHSEWRSEWPVKLYTLGFVNLTPHTINIFNEDGQEIATIKPSGKVARIEVKHELADILNENIPVYSVKTGDVIVYSTESGEVMELSEQEFGVAYIVSGMVADKVNRADVFAPGQLKRDEQGRPIGCIGLIRSSK